MELTDFDKANFNPSSFMVGLFDQAQVAQFINQADMGGSSSASSNSAASCAELDLKGKNQR
jgi:hypothetical protein